MKENPQKKNTDESQKKEKSEKARTSQRLWTPYSDPRDSIGSKATREQEKRSDETEESDEEIRKQIEETLKNLTVRDIVLDFMVSLASLAYQRMGIPEDVNEKYRDLEQAKLAIDCLDSLAKSLKERAPEELLKSLENTIDNLKLNYAKQL